MELSMLIAPVVGSILAKWLGVSIVLIGAGGATILLSIIVFIFIFIKIKVRNDTQEKHFHA
ncbi:hypothetical protein [Bacillus sp. JJ722]|uniref:hypothetical protein n=1 Tax=Bacillus sp. JJ722 TaxID=3122973 RepID=UPI002FFDFF20